MLLLTKAVFAIMIGFLSSTVLGLFLIPLLKKIHLGQKISVFVGEAHRKKEGTPTMGGLIFIVPTVVSTLALIITDKVSYTSNLGIVLLVFIGYACIGFLDDFLSVRKGDNEGLTVYQKLIMQVLIAIGFFYIYMRSGGQTAWVVGTLGIDLELGWLYGLAILFVLVGASNAVNLTDGIDGLDASVTTVVVCFFIMASGYLGFRLNSIFACSAAGAIIGFYMWNAHPAKVFMGDTGSLFLGGLVVSLAFGIGRPILLIFTGIIYLIEALSVMLQVVYYKKTKKRLFKMSPIHHHFELCGWNEEKIDVVFSLVTVVGCIIAFLSILLRW